MNDKELNELLKRASALPPPSGELKARVLAAAARVQAQARDHNVIAPFSRRHLIAPVMGLAASLICGIWVGIGNGYVDSLTEGADITELVLVQAEIFSALEEL